MTRRPVGRLLVALLVTLLVGGVAAVETGAAQEPQAPSVTLVGQTTWARPGEEFAMLLQVVGAPADAVVDVTVHEQLSTRTAFTETVDAESPDLGDVEAERQDPLAALPKGSDGSVRVAWLVGDGGIDLPTHGVYPVEVAVTDAAGNRLAGLVTYLLYVPDSVDALTDLSMAVVMDIGAPPALQPDGAVALDTAELQEINDRITALTMALNVPVSIAPVPETVDGLADSDNTRLLRDLEVAINGREILARPYVDLDLEAMVTAGLLTEVPPEADSGAQVIRTRFNREPMGDLWLLDRGASAEDAAALRDLAISRVVVPQTAVAPVDADEGPVPTNPVLLGDGGPAAMVADDALAARLSAGAGALDVQRFLAELMMIWGTRPGVQRGVVIRLDGEADLAGPMVADALDGLAGGGVLSPVPLSQLFDQFEGQETQTVEWNGNQPAANLTGVADPLHAAQKTLGGLAGMLDDATTITSLRRSLLVSVGATTPTDQRLAYIRRVDQVKAQVGGAIHTPEEFTITLTARSGTIPLAIDNNSDQSIAVRIDLDSSQMSFPDGDSFDRVIRPGRTSLDIRVKLRASGAFPLRVALTSPDGAITLSESDYLVRSTAISGVGIILSVGAGLFLLIWWASHWRTARRSRRLVSRPGV